MAGALLSLRRVLPDRYPLDRDVERYIAEEQRVGRMLDYAVIVPRLQRLYEWSAEELAEPRLLELIRDGSPVYAWPFEQRHVWHARQMPATARALARCHAPAGAFGLAPWLRRAVRWRCSSQAPRSHSALSSGIGGP